MNPSNGGGQEESVKIMKARIIKACEYALFDIEEKIKTMNHIMLSTNPTASEEDRMLFVKDQETLMTLIQDKQAIEDLRRQWEWT